MQYQYAAGFRSRGVSPEVAAAEMERIEASTGKLNASNVFAAARSEDSPIHDEFVWDGEAAIAELGLDRARKLIRAIVAIEPAPDEPPQRVYVRVDDPDQGDPGSREGVYKRIEVVVSDLSLYENAVSLLQAKLDAAQKAIAEVQRAAKGSKTLPDEKRVAIDLAVQGLQAVREAIAVLKV